MVGLMEGWREREREGSLPDTLERCTGWAASKHAARRRRHILASCIIDKLYVGGVALKESERVSEDYIRKLFFLSEESIIFILSSPVLLLICAAQKAPLKIIVFFEDDIRGGVGFIAHPVPAPIWSSCQSG